MASLYEITGKYSEIMNELSYCDDVDQIAALMTAIDSIESEIVEKADVYARVKRNLESESEQLAAEIKRLQTAKKVADNKVQALKTAMMNAMEMLDMKSLQTGIGKWTIKNNPYSVQVIDEKSIPEKYMIPQAPVVDKAAISKHFKETGEIVDGIDMVQGKSIMFK